MHISDLKGGNNMKANRLAWFFGVPIAALLLSLGVMPSKAEALYVTDQAEFYNRIDNVLTATQIFDNGDMHIFTDDTLWLDAAHTVVAKHNIEANGAFVIRNFNLQQPTGSQIWDDRDLHIVTDDYLFLDAPKRVIVKNDVKVRGDLFVAGDATFDNLDLNGTVDISGADFKGNFLPSADSTYDLGSSSKKWRDLYLSGNTINLESGGATITFDGTNDALELDGASIAVGDDPGGSATSSATDGDLWIESGLKIGDSTTPNDFTQFDTGTLFVTGAAEFDGSVRFDGATDFNSTLDVSSASSTFTGNIVPTSADTYSLGSTSAEFANLYIADGPGGVIFGSDQDVTAAWDNTAAALEFTSGLISVGDDPGGALATGAGDLIVSDAFEVDGASQFDGTVTLGDGGDTVAINSSDWDISSTGTITGVAFDANGTGNSLSNVENADLVNDTLDFDKFADAMNLDAATSITGTGGEVFSIARALTDSTDENGVVMTFTAADTGSGSTAQYGLVLDNAASTEGLDSLLVLSNSDTDDPVLAAITLTDAGGGFTNVFNIGGTMLSSAELTVWDGGLDLDELNDSGTLTAGSVDINGGSIDGVTIGAATPASGAFTTLSASGDVDLSATGGSVGDPDLGVPGYALFTGTLDVNGTADFSGGLTNSAGELLVSGGNIQVNDDLVLSFGTDDDTTLSYDETTDDAFEIAGSALVSIGDDPGTSVTATGAGDLLVTGDFEVDSVTDLDGNLFVGGNAVFETRVNLGVQDEDIADNSTGASNATDTLTPTASLVRVSCLDADGCDITMGEGSAVDGDLLVITHDGAVDSNYSDTDGVSNLTAAFAAGDDDVLVLVYDVDEWVEVSRADN